jgi:DNA-binding GntR family transcriptional regulator
MKMKKLLFALLLLASGVAGAAERRVSGADLAEIRAVIHRQIEAFQRDDASAAFALTSPSVQVAFRTAERFMDAMRMAYWAVYRPTRVAFLELVVLENERVVQHLQVTDRSGAVWLALYAMERQQDGSWRANGCHLVQPRNIPA